MFYGETQGSLFCFWPAIGQKIPDILKHFSVKNFHTTPNFFNMPLEPWKNPWSKMFSKLNKKISDQNPSCTFKQSNNSYSFELSKNPHSKFSKTPWNIFRKSLIPNSAGRPLGKLGMLFKLCYLNQSVSDRKSPRTAFIIGR